MEPFTIAAAVLAILLIFTYNLYISTKGKATQLSNTADMHAQQSTLLQEELRQERELLQRANHENAEAKVTVGQLRLQVDHLQEKYNTALEARETDEVRFEQLAHKVLEQKTKSFDKQHKEGINHLLSPLKERIMTFEKKVEQTSKQSFEQHTSLKLQLQQLKELNQQITKEASNLTKALKGDNKTQGNWGELILENILQKSGLQKDSEYFVQSSFRDEDGKTQRPDVVIHLPDDKKMIIDSKVSLKAYESLVNSTDQEEQAVASQAHFRSVKNHIDGLSAKNYHDLYQMETPDFVLMFIPIDTAFATAVAYDGDLYSYAFDKNIVIVTPATLLATLKTVDSIWKNEKQHRYALEIATEAGRMYDKLVAFTEDIQNIGRRIDQTKDAYHDSMKKLTTGKGNLITRAEKIKLLGAKANKSLASNLKTEDQP